MNALHPSLPLAVDANDAGRSVADDSDEGDLLLRVRGILPAADFHPFVVRAARRLKLRGWIRHDSSGALVRAIGPEISLARLVRAIRDDAPPSARVRSMDPEAIAADTAAAGDRFVALVGEPIEWQPSPTKSAALAHVA